nr:zf-CCHC domain-containing protein/UBN2 domain-containing protein [Tanacetum cinerariifolium]
MGNSLVFIGKLERLCVGVPVPSSYTGQLQEPPRTGLQGKCQDLEAFKIKKEKYKSLALKAKKVSSDEEESCSGSDEEYAMAARDFKKLFRRRGKFIHRPYDDKKNLQKVKEEKKGKEERRCFKCGDPNYFINNEVCDLKNKLDRLEKSKEISVECESCVKLHFKIESLSLKLAKFENSSHFLPKMIENQRSQKDKQGLGFTKYRASTSKVKMRKVGLDSEETTSVEPVEPVPSVREPTSSDVGNRPSAEICKKLDSNVIKRTATVRLKVKLEPNEWIKDSGCSRHMTCNKDLFSTHGAINGGMRSGLQFLSAQYARCSISNGRKLLTPLMLVWGGSFEIALIFALSTSRLAPNTLCPSTIPSLTMKDDMIKGRKEGSSKNTYSKLSGRGLSLRSVEESWFSYEAIAINLSNSEKISSSRIVPSMERRILLPSVNTKDHSLSPNSKIELFLFNSNYCISSVKKGSSQDERNFAILFYFKNNEISKEGLRVSRDSFAYEEYGIRLMLEPRSAKALQEKVLLKLHRIKKHPGSPSLGGTLF